MKHKILPVIHVISEKQAFDNIKIANYAGCDGVFLINHAIMPEDLLEIHKACAKKFPKTWIGINCLGLTPKEMFMRTTPEMAGIWMDNAHIDERIENQERATYYKKLREESGWKGLYFGGVAFKYQRVVKDLETACKLSKDYMDVVTTSGPGTAQAADVDKINRMHKALGDFPLAIASGVTIDNIENYLNKATYFLIASGINKDWDYLDENLVEQIVKKVRNYDS